MKTILAITLLALSLLACTMSVATATPTPTTAAIQVGKIADVALPLPTGTPLPAPYSASVVGSWNVRVCGGEQCDRLATLSNTQVTVLLCRDSNGGVWCLLDAPRGWVNAAGLLR